MTGGVDIDRGIRARASASMSASTTSFEELVHVRMVPVFSGVVVLDAIEVAGVLKVAVEVFDVNGEDMAKKTRYL